MTQAFLGNVISERLSTTPEGFLVAQGARLCRSGFQKYYARELGNAGSELVNVYRPPEEVLAPSFLASLEGKCLTDSHPDRFVDTSNSRWHCCGHVQNVRQGPPLPNGDITIIGDLVVFDESLIQKIANGKRELSVGYAYQIATDDDGNFEMRNLVANHIACVESGRAGPEIRILDHDLKENSGRACSCPRELERLAPADEVKAINFAASTRRFLGRNPATVLDQQTSDERKPKMTKTKLKLLRSLLDELEEEREQFVRDAGLEVDDDEFATLASRYLGKPLPLLGEVRDESEPAPDRRRVKAARDSQDCRRRIRAKLPRAALEAAAWLMTFISPQAWLLSVSSKRFAGFASQPPGRFLRCDGEPSPFLRSYSLLRRLHSRLPNFL